ncbi:Uncharacterized protein EbC_pEb17200380 (plasmid) [Erwinia billingiae Eb661]|uniref:Uncharacterized protein n=2 Tax=Erwiniaceae TaxID=1903409 RepID=A0AAN2K9A8_ENTAG|nr:MULTISPECIES: hypothetical protein [Erwiniaceae]CAH6385232.1 hypothetical protein DAPPPG734_25685 [Pantoea agglomerans]CAX53491.1 Uncharacterized protein EbC_pEb17200380 [Erwinia billingiae Eb661]
MDDADLSQETEAAFISNALSARKPALKSPDGKCLWCRDEPVVAGTAFCCAECGEDYARHERQMKQGHRSKKYPSDPSET